MHTPVEGPGGAKTAPCQWKEWVDAKKHRVCRLFLPSDRSNFLQGFLQAPMILRALGEVWGMVLEDVPEHLRPVKPPIGALLLCDQAV